MVSVFERVGYHPVQAFRLKVVCPNRCVLRRFFLFWLRKRQWQKVEKFLDLAKRLKTCRAHGRVRYIPTKGNYKIYLFLGPSIFFLNRSNRQLQNSCESQQAACTNGCEAMREIILLRRGGCYSPLCHLLKPNRLHICNTNLHFMTTAYFDRNNQVIKSVSFTTNRS